MKTPPLIPVLNWLALLLASLSAHTQVVNDGATNTLSNVTNSFTGDVTVGTNGAFTLLVLSDHALLTNSANGVISRNATAKSNEVRLVSPTARWLVGNILFVGSNGANATLVVSNGAFMRSGFARVGLLTASGSNAVLVTGSGSTWTNVNDLVVGLSGSGNQLVVNNGGFVVNNNGSVGNVGSNNVALVTGAGSVWSNRGDLNIASFGAGNVNNRLVVEDGGQAFNQDGYVGGSGGGSNNFAVVTGGGSRWNNRDLRVGQEARCSLLVSNGGTVFSANSFVGLGGSLASFNQATVTGGGSLWSNQFDLVIGVAHTNNSLLVSDGGWVVNSNAYVGGLSAANVSASNNTVTVTGTGSTWSNRADAFIGYAGNKNQLVISNSATIVASNLFVGFNDTSLNNRATVAGGTLRASVLDVRRGAAALDAGLMDVDFLRLTNAQGQFEFNGGTLVSRGAFINNGAGMVIGPSGAGAGVWDVRAGASNHVLALGVIVGNASPFNQLLNTNGASLTNAGVGIIGDAAGANANLVSISGAGSQWQMPGDVIVGNLGSGNRLVIGAGGVVSSGANAIVGTIPASSINNVLNVAGGTLRVLNPGALLDVRGGTNRLDAGLVDVNRLVVTNTRGHFEFNGGTLRTLDTTVANGRVFTVGNGASVATFQLIGGTHTFSNNLVVANNASLIGNGVVDGTITVSAGGKLIPGAPIGRISVLGTVILQGTVNLQIDKSGGILTNDQVTASGAIFYSGTLAVTDIGSDVLTAGDHFPLFSAAPYVSGFTTITLPPLDPGLAWLNKLAVDGSIEVIAATPPRFGSVVLSGTNVVITSSNGVPNTACQVLASTNVALPLSNWVSIATNQFDGSGRFVFTNAITPAIPKLFFQLRLP